ncbi:MAG: NUDIX hydrolase [Aigarchaeota archaeon]|nr:NUDIX hydrolase [Aigarchaeota archaeon]MDW8092138.1 NUDIX hydrolase [Nitrososphaerota archaeon]
MERSPEVAVGVVCVRDGRVFLVRRARPPSEGLWAIPGGRVKFGERLQDAAIREFREETGLTVELLRTIEVVDLFIGSGDEVREHYVVINYEGRITGGELRCSDEVLEAGWIPLRAIEDVPVSDSTRQFLKRHFDKEEGVEWWRCT